MIVSVFSVEYPTDWPDFFQKLGTAVTLQPFSEVRIELYLQILHSIEELISMEFVRNNADIAHSNKIVRFSIPSFLFQKLFFIFQHLQTIPFPPPSDYLLLPFPLSFSSSCFILSKKT